MEKNFKQYAEQVNKCNALFSQSVKDKQDEINKILVDWRYSEKGKQEKKEAFFKELNAAADNMTKVFKEAVKHFCNDFAIVLPDDGVDHSKDIENGLRIIEMLGFNMDEKNLDNIMRPLRKSYSSMKTIVDVMEAKNNGSAGAAGLGYDLRIMNKLYEYMGISTRVTDYMDLFGLVEDIMNGQDGYKFSLQAFSNSTFIELVDIVPYSFLACADWIKQAGEMYGELETEFTALFTNHVPTDKEMIESVLTGNQ